jgi:peptide/nickel transport system ATP-binding protein
MHGERKAMTGIAGSPPDLRSVPSGCAFHPRCLHAMDRCSADVPQLVPLTSGPPAVAGRSPREVACWLHDPQSPYVPEELGRPDPALADPADPGPAPAPAAEAEEEGTS